MKTDKEIADHYNKHIEFYGDNWGAAFEEMIYFRQMVEQARIFVRTQAMSPQANEWLAKYESIVDIEDQEE